MKTDDYIARRFEQAKAINRRYGAAVVRYSVDLDELVPWDFEVVALDEQIDELEDDYSEESFP